VTTSERTSTLRELALEREMDYFGVTPVERLAGAPEGGRPTDIRPSARSVVVMGMRIGEGVGQVQRRVRQDPGVSARYGIFVYHVYGYNILNDKMNLAAYALGKVLEKEGHPTVPIPASPPYDSKELLAIFSHRHAAVAAGLGQLGWNKIVIFPDHGSRVRLVSLITEAELEPSPVYDGPRLCDPDACGRVCARECPTKCLSDVEFVRFEVDGVPVEHGAFDKRRCLSAPCGACLTFCPAGGAA
jgi:epoxyqueuosine reductase QueG